MGRLNIFHQYYSVLAKRSLSRIPPNGFPSGVLKTYTKLKDNAFTKVSEIKEAVDGFVGITEVQTAQINVREAENEFMKTRKKVGEIKQELDFVYNQLAEVRSRLDRTPRHDEKYLALATDEHSILREEKRLRSVYDQVESLERDQFILLSAAVRNAHERERARAERTKYWSVVGSLGGALLGILSSTVVNYVRLKEIKNSVKETKESLIEKSETVKDSVESQSLLLQTKLTDIRDTVNAFLETNANSVLVSLLSQPDNNASKNLSQKISKHDVDKMSELYAELLVKSELVQKNNSAIQESISEVQSGLVKVQDLLQLQNKKLFAQSLDESIFPVENSFPKIPSVSVIRPQDKENQSFDETKWWIRANLVSTLISLGVLIYLECFR